MRSKGLITFLIIAGSAAFSWLAVEAVGQIALGGGKQYTEWRADHVAMVLTIWIIVTVVVMLSALWIVGRRMFAAAAERERELAEAKGVGRITIQALRGNEAAAEKLVLLLKDPSKPVRFQAVRALAMLDDEDINPTLFRIVRYWPGEEKLELIDVLKRTNDIRMAKLLNELTADRSPNVSRKARAALSLALGSGSRGPTKEEDEARRSRRLTRPSKPGPADRLTLALARGGKPRPSDAAADGRPAQAAGKGAGATTRSTASGGCPTVAKPASAAGPSGSSGGRPKPVRPAERPSQTAKPTKPSSDPEAPAGS
jgi:hypothetical protein